MYAAGCPVTNAVWNAIIDLPVPGDSAQARIGIIPDLAKAVWQRETPERLECTGYVRLQSV